MRLRLHIGSLGSLLLTLAAFGALIGALIGTLTILSTLLPTPLSAQISVFPSGNGGGQAAIACLATPGNTIGAYRQQCQTTGGVIYACNNVAGCTMAADWVVGGGAAGPTGPTGPGYLATSTTSLLIGTGSTSFTTQAGLAYVPGNAVQATNSANPVDFMFGLVTSYSGTTLVVNVTAVGGSGTFATWNISLQGAAGAAGATGSTGATGPGYLATSTTSLLIGTGSTGSVTTQAGLAYVIGNAVQLTAVGSPTNFMFGLVTSYSGTTIVVNTTVVGGSGTFTSWSITLQGAAGAAGATGSTGATGPTGPLGTSATTGVITAGTVGNVTFTHNFGSLIHAVGPCIDQVTGQMVTGWTVGVPLGGTSDTLTFPVALTHNTICYATSGGAAAAFPTPGTSTTFNGAAGIYVCTSTCTVTFPLPAPGSQFCVFNGDNVSTIITLAALGGSALYEATARTGFGTAGTGTFTSGGAVADSICILGQDTTHYLTPTFHGTWVAH